MTAAGRMREAISARTHASDCRCAICSTAMQVDLTASSAREQRDEVMHRTDVLDKVGVLRTLPDDMHVTTEMVAQFYAVPRETVFTLVRNNRDEIEDDGYRVVTRTAFEETFKSKVTSSAPRIALFPRRAVLRVGMLLRDSDVAREVRTFLLDTERAAAPESPLTLTDDEIVAQALQIQGRRIAELTARIEADAPKVAAFDALMESDGTYSMAATAKILGWGRTTMMLHLRRQGILQSNNLPYQRYAHHFKVTAGTYKNRKTGDTVPYATAFVRPRGVDFLRKKLAGSAAVVEL